ncbi:hypothetical protein TrRE_jg3545, partial [Triparma retinervis]
MFVSRLRQAHTASRRLFSTATASSTATLTDFNAFNPTEEHKGLREMVRSFAENEVEPQALEYNRAEKFNIPLFRKLGDLGLLGITVP